MAYAEAMGNMPLESKYIPMFGAVNFRQFTQTAFGDGPALRIYQDLPLRVKTVIL